MSWHSIGVAGYPFAYRVALEDAVLRDTRLTPSPELRIPALSPGILSTSRKWRTIARR